MELESYVLEIIEGRHPSKLMKTLLFFASCFFRMGVRARHFLYDKKWLKSQKVPIPVISVGNIVVGGTGKTPLVRLLAEELLNVGKVAILSRGYRSKIEETQEIVEVSKRAGPLFSPLICGDEPYWLATHLPQAAVFVGKDRRKAAQRAYDQKAELILLDDGMQYRKLERDFELIVMDAGDLFGKNHFLPRGLLREHPKRLKYADLIILNRVRDLAHYEALKKEIALYSSSPCVGMRLCAKEQFLSKKVGLFCGIGNPKRFVETVTSLGATVVDCLFTLDHLTLEREQLEAFASRCKGKDAEMLVCTEKDFVKLPLDIQTHLPITPIETKLEIVAGEEHWQHLINKIKGTQHE